MSALGAVGVVIGRFQIDALHEGHMRFMQYVRDRHSTVLVLVGVPASPATERDPLDYRTRDAMIRKLWPGVAVLPVMDCPTNEAWSRRIDALIDTMFIARGAVIYAGRDGCLSAYVGRHGKHEVPDLCPGHSGTERRRAIASDPPRESADFRAGVIHAIATLTPRIFLTVDTAVFDGPPQARRILLVKKPDESGWRLPGGHVSLGDSTLEAAARRECVEETGIFAETPVYVGSFTVKDWRTEGREGVKYLTALCRADFVAGPGDPTAADDVSDAKWWPTDHGIPKIQPEHVPLVIAAVKADHAAQMSAEAAREAARLADTSVR